MIAGPKFAAVLMTTGASIMPHSPCRAGDRQASRPHPLPCRSRTHAPDEAAQTIPLWLSSPRQVPRSNWGDPRLRGRGWAKIRQHCWAKIRLSRTFRGDGLVLLPRVRETVDSHPWGYARVSSFHVGFRALRSPGSASATNRGSGIHRSDTTPIFRKLSSLRIVVRAHSWSLPTNTA
jgi:hypothetical protein